jgi:hypothetical protein
VARGVAIEERQAKYAAACSRLASIRREIFEAMKLLDATRKSLKLPLVSGLLRPSGPPRTLDAAASIVDTVEKIDASLADLNAVRKPPIGGLPREAMQIAAELDAKRQALDEYKQRIALEAEVSKILDEDNRAYLRDGHKPGSASGSVEERARERVASRRGGA